MHSGFSFRNVSDDLQSEIARYTQQHEPPLEHQIIRVIISLSNELKGSQPFDVNKIRFLTSSDVQKSKVIISLPCENISQNLQEMITQIMANFNYKPLNKSYIENLKELQLYFSI